MTEEDFGSRMKALRQARKMTQAQLAFRIGVTLRALAYWEAGAHMPGLQELDGLVHALDLTPEERQALTALLPVGKVSRIVRAMPAWAGIAPPPGTGDLIRSLRWRKRLSREQLADTLGVHRTTLLRWEEQQAVPNAETRLRLCDALGALPAERAVLLSSGDIGPLWNGVAPTLETCREAAARLQRDSHEQVDPLFDLRAHLLAGTLWNLAARQPQARSVLAQTYAAHARFACIRGDDAAALDYSERCLELVRQGAAPVEDVYDLALWASGHALAHRAPHSGPGQSLRQVKQWLPKVQTPNARASLLLSGAWWALQIGAIREAQDYWHRTNALVNGSPHPNHSFRIWLPSVYAGLLIQERRYDEALQVGLQIASDLYQRQIMRQLFQTNVFLKAGDKSSADGHLRCAYHLIATYQADLYRKQADQLAAKLERLA